MTTVADVDPAADHPLHLPLRVAVRMDPVVDAQDPARQMQGAVLLQWLAVLDHPQIVLVKLLGFIAIKLHAFQRTPADHRLAGGTENFQIVAVAGHQPRVTIPHIDRVRRTVDERLHEVQLLAPRTFGLLTTLVLGAHPQIPQQRNKDQQERCTAHLVDQAAVIEPCGLGHIGFRPPAVLEDVDLIRGNLQQCLLEDGTQLGVALARGERQPGRQILDDAGHLECPLVLGSSVVLRNRQQGHRRVRFTRGHHLQ
ncbi:hypothetical protein D3C81_413460 [compost metagenome]